MAEPNNTYKFRGFQNPNYTIVPDELFDELLALLSGAELKILLYIIRRTFGFKKDSDEISLSQICKGISKKDGQVLDQGTGLSQSTAQIAIKRLEEKRIIVATRRVSAERGNEPTTYSLNFVQPSTENRQRGVPKIGEGLYRKSATQETVKQETDIHLSNIRKGSPKFEKKEEPKTKAIPRLDASIPDKQASLPDRSGVRTPANSHSHIPSRIPEVEVERRPLSYYDQIVDNRNPSENQTSENQSGFQTAGSVLRADADKRPRRPHSPHASSQPNQPKPTQQAYDEDRQVILEFIEDFAREFNDQASLKSSTTRAYNLYQQSGLPIGTFISKMHEARSVTKESTAQIRSQGTNTNADASKGKGRGGPPAKKKMAYWFSVLADTLGMKDQAENRSENTTDRDQKSS